MPTSRYLCIVRKLFIYSICFLCPLLILSQSLTIQGKLVERDGKTIPNATVQLNNNKGTTTNNNGEFLLNLNTTGSSFKLTFRHLGYITLDTTILKTNIHVPLEIKLEKGENLQEGIEITASKFNAFGNNKWKILDYDFYENNLILLYYKAGSRYLGLFGERGYLKYELPLLTDYESIFISCSNNIHLAGKNKCMQVSLQDEILAAVSVYNKEQFTDLIEPCVFNRNGSTVFKNITSHNKKCIYFQYNEDHAQNLLYSIHDETATRVSQSRYHDIIRYYNKEIKSPKPTDINAGFKPDNIITIGEWSGELIDLWIDNDIHPMISYYIDVASKPINTFEYTSQDKLHIIDFVNQKIAIINISGAKVKTLSTEEIDLIDFDQVLFDKSTEQAHILNQDLEIIPLLVNKDKVSSDTISTKLKLKGFLPRGVRINKNKVYYLTNMNAASYVNTLQRIPLR